MYSQPHELIQGGIVYDSEVSPDTPWRFETMAVTTGYDNREIKLQLRLSAPDGQALAQSWFDRARCAPSPGRTAEPAIF